MKISPPQNPDATTQLFIGTGETDDVVLEASDVDLSPASAKMHAPPPLPEADSPTASDPQVQAPARVVPPPPGKPRYWIYALVLIAFFSASVAAAALLLRATAPKRAPAAAAAKAPAAPSSQPTVITISPVDMSAPESTP